MIAPKEHGAYGQLLFPLMTAMAIGRPGAAALALTGAAIAGFLAHEPLVVLLGERGSRASREHGAAARRSLKVLGTIAGGLGAVAMFEMPVPLRWTILMSALCAALLGVWIARRREHTTSGEILSVVALASPALPVGVASGAPLAAALTCALAYSGAFIAASVGVRTLIHYPRSRGSTLRAGALLVCLAVPAALAWLPRNGLTKDAGFWAVLPVCSVALGLVTFMPAPRHLRTVGWVLVGATGAAALILIAGLH